MGTSVPREPIWREGAPPAERALWRWAVDQLPDDVLVLPGVRLTDRGDGVDAEADLVLLDPGWGVLVVEVKGGAISFDEDHHVWWRDLGGGRRKEVRDPVEQAQRARSIVKKALDEHRVGQSSVAVWWAVATPECRLDAPGGSYLPPAQLWDSLAADQLAVLHRRAQRDLGAGELPPGRETVAMAADVLRGRPVRGRATVAAAVALHEDAVVAHTESHRDVLNAFAHHRRVRVVGAAGTGKTWLAIEAAARSAADGDRVLLVCWNAVLGAWLRERLRAELREMRSPMAAEVTRDPTGRIVVGDVVGVADDVRPAAVLAGEDARRVYHEELPDRLTTERCGGTFDAVVIDEAQDLTELWLVALGALVGERGRVYAFAHAGQDLFGAAAALGDLCPATYRLREGFRNTRQVTEVARWFARHLPDAEEDVECIAGEGPPVRFVAAPAEHVPARAREVARRLQREERLGDGDVAVLHLFTNPYRGNTAAVIDAVETDGLVETNAATFKGMERKAVVLGLDLDAAKLDRREEAARAAYVGATRARSLLVVVGAPDVVEAAGFSEIARRLAG